MENAKHLDQLLACLTEPPRNKIEHRERLEQVLEETVDRARAAWPTLEVPVDEFIAYLAERLPQGAPLEAAIAGMHADELYLACGCARGDSEAIRAFEARYFATVEGAVSRLRQPAAVADEVKQLVREHLFVATSSDGPLIRGYSGRGRLRNWVRIIAVRTTGRLIDQEKKELLLTNSVLGGLAPAEGDLELDYLKATYRAEFSTAFSTALQSLSARERNLLAQHYVDRLSIDEMGLIYGSHRATIARWLARARETLLQQTRARLMEQIQVDRAEYESIMRLIESQLPVTFARGDE